MKNLLAFFKEADRVLVIVLKSIAILAFTVLTVIMTLNIINRFIPVLTFTWLDEIVEMSFAALVFYGAAVVWIDNGHFSVGDWVSKVLKLPTATGIYRIIVEIFSLTFVGILFRYSWQLTMRAGDVTAVFQIPKGVLYSCIPISSAIMCLYSVIRIVKQIADLADGTKKARPADLKK